MGERYLQERIGMVTGAHCRRTAQAVLDHEAESCDPAERAVWLELAQAWLDLADAIENQSTGTTRRGA